jgi:hypothetical protein
LKIKGLYEGPHGAGLVIGGQGKVQIAGAQFDLIAHRTLHARRAFGRAPLQDSGAVRRNTQALEQCACVPTRSRFGRDAGHAKRHAAFVPLNVHSSEGYRSVWNLDRVSPKPPLANTGSRPGRGVGGRRLHGGPV